jgi:RNA dependent RNA polymerase/Rho termination factor, N-terminal domain
MKALKEMSKAELYEVAKLIGLSGRSKMNKDELLEALLMEGVEGMTQFGAIVYSNQNNKGEDASMTRQQQRAAEREFIKTMGQAIRELTKFNPALAEAALREVKKGRSVRKALYIVKDRNGQLTPVVDEFFANFYVPKRLRPAKKTQVVVLKIDSTKAVMKNGKYYATERFEDITDYSAGSGYMRTSVSDLIEKAGLETYSVQGLALNVSKRIMIVDLGEYNDETKERIDSIMANGIYIVENGVEKHYVYALRSNSQARQLKAMFILNDGKYTIASFLRKLGHEPVVYAKYKDGVYVLDATKPDKRKGLSGTSTFKLFSFSFGRKVRYEGNDIIIEGGPFTMRIVEDVHAVIKSGQFKAIDKDNKQIVVLDAAQHPQKVVVGDGQCFVNARVAHIIHQEAGVFGAAFQHRTGAMIKGMFISVPDLDQYYKEDFVVFAGSAKGNIVEYLKAGHNIEVRVARINPAAKTTKKFTMFPYQFTHILNLSAEEMFEIVKPHLDKAKDMLYNPEIMKEYLGMSHMDEVIEDMGEAEAAEYLDAKLTTLLTKALYHSKGVAYADAYIKRSAFKLISLMIRRWITGQIPVQGHYKYLVQDPKAILEALKANQRDEDGDIIVPEHVGLRPGQVVAAVWNEELGHEVCYEGKAALLRNPAVTQGEAAAVEAVHDDYYAAALKEGFYSNLAIVSCHDFTLIRQGGADVDGDTSFVVFEPTIVKAVHGMDKPALLDRYFTRDENGEYVFGDGCPWTGAEGDEFIVKFTPEEYNDDLIEKIHELEKKWVIRTLQQNKIGYLTNCATILADKKRQLVYAIREGKDLNGQPLTPQKRDHYLEIIEDYQNKIDWIRYAQGWEIDRAKHGGEYEKHLENELAFVFDKTQLPTLCSYVANKKTGERKWVKPLWFTAFNKCETADEMMMLYQEWMSRDNKPAVHSVLNKHFITMINWYNNIREEFKAYEKQIDKHNLIGFLAPMNIDRDTFMAIANELKPIANEYSVTVSNIMNEYRNHLDNLKDLVNRYVILPEQYALEVERLDDARKQMMDQLIAETKHKIAQLEIVEQYDPAVVGYVSYIMTYSVVKRSNARTLSFPWVITEEYVMAALRKATEIQQAGVQASHEVIEESFVIQAYVPDHLTKEEVAKQIALTKHYGVYAIRRQAPTGEFKYYLYVVSSQTGKFEAMGVFFDSIVEKYFLGADKIKISLDEVYTSGRRVVNIAGSRMVKA